jgi:hypothetical protein
MAKRRLPPMQSARGPMSGRDVDHLAVGSWTPTPDGSGKPVYVALSIELATGESLVCRLKTPALVDDLIQALLRHKRDVWPDAP